MKTLRIIIVAIGIVVLLSVSACAEKSIKKTALPKLVDLGAHKCIPCKKMAPILEELKADYSSSFGVEFIDVWEMDNAEIAKAYKIKSIPTQIFLDENGKELYRHVGYFSKEEILSVWAKLGYKVNSKESKLVHAHKPCGSSDKNCQDKKSCCDK